MGLCVWTNQPSPNARSSALATSSTAVLCGLCCGSFTSSKPSSSSIGSSSSRKPWSINRSYSWRVQRRRTGRAACVMGGAYAHAWKAATPGNGYAIRRVWQNSRMTTADRLSAKRDLVAQWAFDTRPVLLRFHLWLEDVEVDRAQAEPVSAHTFAPRGIARCLAMTSAATALGTRLFGESGAGAKQDKATVNQVKKAADAVSAYVRSEGLWHP